MKVMILAAGRGQRMQPLTDTTPKPLLKAGGKPLIVWHLEKLARAGMTDVVINLAWLGQQIRDHLGNGSAFGVQISYSNEKALGLETAGGIARALPLLGHEPFLVMNGDVWTDWEPTHLQPALAQMQSRGLDAWLTLVPNPAHHPDGDFSLSADKLLIPPSREIGTWTYSGIGLYHPRLFRDVPPERKAPLGGLLVQAMHRKRIGADIHQGQWYDIGTPERLTQLDLQLQRCRQP